MVFKRLNSNAKMLSHQELRHSNHNGWLINRAEQEAENPFWKEIKISSTSKARRMKDVEFISIFMLVILENRIVGFPQSALDDLYAKYEIITDATEEDFFDKTSFDALNDGLEQDDSQLKFDEQVTAHITPQDDIDDFENKFLAIKVFISELSKLSDIITVNKVFGKKRTTHLYTLWTYLALAEIPTDIEKFKKKYEEFFSIVETLENTNESDWQDIAINETKRNIVISYYTNAMGATTEEPQRKARLETLKQFLAV